MAITGRILVTGGAGYIGSHVVRAVLGRGWTPVVLDDLRTGHRQSVPDGIEFAQAALGDRRALAEVLGGGGIEAVVHLAGAAYVGESVESPGKYYRTNVVEGLNLLEAMREAGVGRIVFSSSCTVYGIPNQLPIPETAPLQPISPYGRTKLVFEQILGDFGHAHGLGWVALRYFNAAGADPGGDIGEDHHPEPHLIPRILQSVLPGGEREPVAVYGDDYPTRDGTCVRDYIHVSDLADAHVRALDYLAAGGKPLPVNLANERGFSVLEVIQACREATGVEIPYTRTARRPGDPPELVGDAGRACAVLGWQPRITTLSQIVGTAWQWHRRHPDGYAGLPGHSE